MSEPKTCPTGASVADFLAAVEPAGKRADAEAICALIAEITSARPVLWGTSIIGFGAYTASGNAKKPAEWPLVGFSPRKANLVFYIVPGFSRYADLTARLGKFSTGSSCLYIKKLADIDMEVLKTLIVESVAYMRAHYTTRL